MPDQPELTLDDIRNELSPMGRELLDQAVGSASRIKQMQQELAKARNASQPVPPAGEPRA